MLLSWALPGAAVGSRQPPGRAHRGPPAPVPDVRGPHPRRQLRGGDDDRVGRGHLRAEKVTDTKLTVVLEGRRAGRCALFQTDGRNWMIHRMDPPADPDRRHPPERYELIQPHPGPGLGAVSKVGDREPLARPALRAAVERRRRRPPGAGTDPVTPQFPGCTVGRALGATEVALDGVITAAGAGRPRLERRLAAGSDSTRRRLARDEPVSFVAFDLLWQDGHPTTRSRGERRRRLEDLALEGPAWTTPSAITGDVPAVLAAAAGAGVEKLVAKRTDAAYDLGPTRSRGASSPPEARGRRARPPHRPPCFRARAPTSTRG